MTPEEFNAIDWRKPVLTGEYINTISIEDLKKSHIPAILDRMTPLYEAGARYIDDTWYEFNEELYKTLDEKHNQDVENLKKLIGTEMYFVLNPDKNIMFGKSHYTEPVVLRVRLGNLVYDKIFIDFPTEFYHPKGARHHGLSKYPYRGSDQYGNPISEQWRRIYWGTNLCDAMGTLWYPDPTYHKKQADATGLPDGLTNYVSEFIG